MLVTLESFLDSHATYEGWLYELSRFKAAVIVFSLKVLVRTLCCCLAVTQAISQESLIWLMVINHSSSRLLRTSWDKKADEGRSLAKSSKSTWFLGVVWI